MTAQPLLSGTILIIVMTVFLFVLTQKRVMTAFTNNVLGLMKVMCGTRVTLLSFGTREYLVNTTKSMMQSVRLGSVFDLVLLVSFH